MRLNRLLLAICLFSATSVMWTSCKKNDLSVNVPGTSDSKIADPRVLNGVRPDDPKLLAKVPLIMSAEFLARKQKVLLSVQLKANPIKGPKGNGQGGGSGTGGDVTPPTVTISSPAGGSTFQAGTNVTVSGSASDNTGISLIGFSVDGVSMNSTTSSAYSFSWNTTGVASGTHTITVTAMDAANNSAYASIIVTVNTVIITPPPSTTAGLQISMPPVTSQGSEGSCVAFAVGYNARSAEQFNKTGAASYGYGSNIFSPEYLFDQIKTDNSCSGSTVMSALNFLQSNGVCTWQSAPYSSSNGCSITPTAAQIAEAANYKISSYAMIYTTDTSAVKAMLNLKHPLIISFNVDSYFYNAGPGFIWKTYSPTLLGQHCITICGYDDAKHAYKVVNSWGTGWGDGGYSWIDYDFMPTVAGAAIALML